MLSRKRTQTKTDIITKGKLLKIACANFHLFYLSLKRTHQYKKASKKQNLKRESKRQKKTHLIEQIMNGLSHKSICLSYQENKPNLNKEMDYKINCVGEHNKNKRIKVS